MQDTPFHDPAYLASDQGEICLLICRSQGVAIGLTVLRRRLRWGWWSWDDWDAERRPSVGVAPLPAWTVETIWVHPAVQSHGLARRLIDTASQQVEQPVASFAWRRPFTPSGEAFVRRSCPEGFWVPE
jgi:GNAT superfamily N-acetyltransferase